MIYKTILYYPAPLPMMPIHFLLHLKFSLKFHFFWQINFKIFLQKFVSLFGLSDLHSKKSRRKKYQTPIFWFNIKPEIRNKEVGVSVERPGGEKMELAKSGGFIQPEGLFQIQHSN